MKKKTIDRDTPIRVGKIYCSRGCGCGCTHEAYLQAKRTATRIAKALGPKWEPAVWENMGWHGKARLPGSEKNDRSGHGACVHPAGRGYTFFSGTDNQVVAEGTTPMKAFLAGLEGIKRNIRIANEELLILIRGTSLPLIRKARAK